MFIIGGFVFGANFTLNPILKTAIFALFWPDFPLQLSISGTFDGDFGLDGREALFC